MNPVERVERELSRLHPRGHYSLIDAVMLNVTLGLFEKSGIQAAALDVRKLEDPRTVRFDPQSGPGAGAQICHCVQDGKIYFYFDRFEIVSAIAKTSRSRFFVFNHDLFTPFFLTPVTTVITGPSFDNFDSALEWVEQRYRKAEEVLPSVLTVDKSKM